MKIQKMRTKEGTKPSLLPGKRLQNTTGRDSQPCWFEMALHALSRALSFPLICCAFAIIAVSLLETRDERLHWARITLHLLFRLMVWWAQTSLVAQIVLYDLFVRK